MLTKMCAAILRSFRRLMLRQPGPSNVRAVKNLTKCVFAVDVLFDERPQTNAGTMESHAFCLFCRARRDTRKMRRPLLSNKSFKIIKYLRRTHILPHGMENVRQQNPLLNGTDS